MDENLFESLFIKTDVTALKIIKRDYLLAGIGNILHLFHIHDVRLIDKKCIFQGQKIHGLVPSKNDEKIIIYGGKQLQLASLIYKNESIDIVIKNILIKCNDWIITLIWTKNDTNIAILTAHNLVQIWDISSNALLRVYDCKEKCILYSGLLYEADTEIIVFAGTVFSQTIIWHTNNELIRHRLIGHKGVIFSISLNVNENMIVTTSDDRTVRLWTIIDLIDAKNLECWIGCRIRSKITMIGHTARVMHNTIVGKNIISIGEDSAMCIWDSDGNLINKRRIHQDACLWSVDADKENDIVITGGGDGGIIAHSLLLEQSKNLAVNTLKFSVDNMVAKKLCYTFRGNIICLTEIGDVLYYDFETEQWSFKLDSEIKYSNLSISTCKQFIAVYDINGQMDIFAETCKNEPNLIHCINQKLVQDKLLSFHWLHGRNFITCETNGIISVWESRGDKCMKNDEFILPACKERWLTAVNIVNTLLIVGDRCGNVHLLKKQSVHPMQTIFKVHGRLGVNSIDVSGNKIITTGRDSTVKYFKLVSDSKNEINAELLYSIKLPFNWIDRFVGDRLVCGFRETHFLVWNVKENQCVFEFDCGGGHRSWDIIKKWTNKSSHLQFAYIKNTLVNTYDINLKLASKSIFEGYQTKEINAIKLFVLCDNNFSIISGGEDTTLRIHNCRNEKTSFTFDETFRITKHLSSIRDMCVCPISKSADCERYILFTAGGRAQICVWNILSTITDNGTMDECKEIVNYMHKTDLDRKGNKSWRQVQVDIEPETRFMSLTCYKRPELDNGILLFAGCSDGYLRIYSLNNENDINYNFVLKNSYNFNSRCILKVLYLNIKSYIIILTMYTNGVVAFWDFTSYINNAIDKSCDIEPFYHKKTHKSGINSFDVEYIDDATVLLATGGDDNDLRLNIISFSVDDLVRVNDIIDWHCDKYHCSQITGIKFLNRNYLLSTSIDQRITLLKWKYGADDEIKINCEFIRQYHTSVSDIQGMDVYNRSNNVFACVYGKGAEVISIKLPD